MKIIAVEEHFNAEAMAEYQRTKKGISVPDQYQGGRAHLAKRLSDMDKAGINMQVLSLGMRGLNEIPAADGTAISRDADDEMAEITRQYPERFAAFVSLAPQDPQAAADELERGVNKLGFKGGFVNSHTMGKYLDEPEFEVLLERASSLDVPIYIHPNAPSPDMIRPYSKLPGLLGVVWGFGAETSLHAIRLIGSGTFDKYPNLKIILGHMGEAIPFWLWRLDRHWPFEKNKKTGPKLKPSEYMGKNLFVTTSGMFWPTVIQFVYLSIGAHRMMFGVDYPIENNIDAVNAVNVTPMSHADKEKLMHLTAEKLLRL